MLQEQRFGLDWWKLPLSALPNEQENDSEASGSPNIDIEPPCFEQVDSLSLADDDHDVGVDKANDSHYSGDMRAGGSHDIVDPVVDQTVDLIAHDGNVDATEGQIQPLEKLGEAVDQAAKALEEASWMADVQHRLRVLNESSVSHCANTERLGLEIDEKGVPRMEMKRDFTQELPRDIIERVFQWLLSPQGLDTCARISREWARVAKLKWHQLCAEAWGLKRGSRKVYLHWLKRWGSLQASFSGLQSGGGHRRAFVGGMSGTVARKRLFEALETLVELGAACNKDARYPAQVPMLLQSEGVVDAMLMLLDDESPYLKLLAVRCLADIAAVESQRCKLRETIVSEGPLVRKLLEVDDDDLVEAAARLMVNCHGNAPGVPLSVRCRGPAGFRATAVQTSSKSKRADLSEDADPWAGVWAGEMRYGRGGERHAVIRLVLGSANDPVVERILAESCGLDATLDDEEAPDDATPLLRAEGNAAEYWRHFGFLATSDFDGKTDAIEYMNEQLRLRQQPTLSARTVLSHDRETGPAMVGEGWDEQNGHFTIQAHLPRTLTPTASASSRQRSPALAVAMPLRLTLTYQTRGSRYELLGFLAEASSKHVPGNVETVTSPEESKGSAQTPCALYGVWTIAPANHKHLFVLRKVAMLSDARQKPRGSERAEERRSRMSNAEATSSAA